MTNAMQAIHDRADKYGWSCIVADVDGVIYAKGGDRVAIKYKMFGTPNNYMLRWYHKDLATGINWGVETAVFGGELVTGKNKKQQILTYLRTH